MQATALIFNTTGYFMKKTLIAGAVALLMSASVSAQTLFFDTADGGVNYIYGSIAKGGPQGNVGGGTLNLASRYVSTSSNWAWSTNGQIPQDFTDQAIIDAGTFTFSYDIAEVHPTNPVMSGQIGAPAIGNPSAYYVSSSALRWTIHSNGNVYIYSQAGQQETPLGIPVADAAHVEVVVNMDSDFSAGATATATLSVNGTVYFTDFPFTWQDGSNRINLEAQAGHATNGGGTNYCKFDNLSVTTTGGEEPPPEDPPAEDPPVSGNYRFVLPQDGLTGQ